MNSCCPVTGFIAQEYVKRDIIRIKIVHRYPFYLIDNPSATAALSREKGRGLITGFPSIMTGSERLKVLLRNVE
jgi:hypothetical protein